jgi:hypothetical protein
MPMTYFVVVYFDRDAEDELRAGDSMEVTSATAAERAARSLSHIHAGAIAFSSIGDPATGEFQEAVILARFGEVDLDALSA